MEPLGLVHRVGDWHLIAVDVADRNVRHFASQQCTGTARQAAGSSDHWTSSSRSSGRSWETRRWNPQTRPNSRLVHSRFIRAHSSARLERIPDKDEVAGSNPAGPTLRSPCRAGGFCLAGRERSYLGRRRMRDESHTGTVAASRWSGQVGHRSALSAVVTNAPGDCVLRLMDYTYAALGVACCGCAPDRHRVGLCVFRY